MTATSPLLEIDGLRIHAGATPLVDGVSLTLARGESLGIVGESGSGKSLTCRSVLGILPDGLSHTADRLALDGVDLRTLSPRAWRDVRGTRVGAVFQDPASYLNPSLTVGRQLVEVLRVKAGRPRRAARAEAVALFGRLGLRDPDLVAHRYPHELSGGMLQRVLIAIAIAESPDLLIADEPTTALDATVQAEVLDVLADLRRDRGLALLFVSHDLAVVAQVCERIVVMRHGRIVEAGATAEVLAAPQHPYTRALLTAHEEYGLDRFRDPAEVARV
jgi:ABC-type dipeptide/oligopeptide/nickel transport system ATPase component